MSRHSVSRSLTQGHRVGQHSAMDDALVDEWEPWLACLVHDPGDAVALEQMQAVCDALLSVPPPGEIGQLLRAIQNLLRRLTDGTAAPDMAAAELLVEACSAFPDVDSTRALHLIERLDACASGMGNLPLDPEPAPHAQVEPPLLTIREDGSHIVPGAFDAPADTASVLEEPLPVDMPAAEAVAPAVYEEPAPPLRPMGASVAETAEPVVYEEPVVPPPPMDVPAHEPFAHEEPAPPLPPMGGPVAETAEPVVYEEPVLPPPPMDVPAHEPFAHEEPAPPPPPLDEPAAETIEPVAHEPTAPALPTTGEEIVAALEPAIVRVVAQIGALELLAGPELQHLVNDLSLSAAQLAELKDALVEWAERDGLA